jgi:hypothetical protein
MAGGVAVRGLGRRSGVCVWRGRGEWARRSEVLAQWAVAELAWLHLWGFRQKFELSWKKSARLALQVAHSLDVPVHATLNLRGRGSLPLFFPS